MLEIALDIGKRMCNMNEKINNVLLVGIVVLLLSACGQLDSVPPSDNIPEAVVTVVEDPTNTLEPAEDIPTAVLTVKSDPEQFTKYIGLVHPPTPVGLSMGFSMLIQDKDSYGLSMVSDGANKMLWLEKIAQYDANGSPIWVVKDVLGLSNLEAGLTLIPDACRLNGVSDWEILVAHRNGVIRYAWRANTTLGRFESVSSSGIACDSDKAVSLE